MNIYGLNIASSAGNPNGRGGIHPDRTFQYLPIEEHCKLARNAPTYREYCRKMSFADVKLKRPDLRVHLDPEFETFTYGHVKRGFGDQHLWNMVEDDILFFYATLDLLEKPPTWGLYIVGYFIIDHVVDTRKPRKMSADQVRRLKGFEQNAHLRRVKPGVDLLIKGSKDSRLYEHAIHLSCPRDSHRLHPDFTHQLTTVTGKPLKGKTWHRWLFHSHDRRLAERLRRST